MKLSAPTVVAFFIAGAVVFTSMRESYQLHFGTGHPETACKLKVEDELRSLPASRDGASISVECTALNKPGYPTRITINGDLVLDEWEE